METKKTKRADLEGKRMIFLEIGLIVALSFILMALQWKSPDKKLDKFETYYREAEVEEIIPITEQQKLLPPPPVHQARKINIVTNDQKPQENIIIDAEANEETAIEEYIPVQDFVHVDEEVVEEEPIFIVVESAPGFPGGTAALMQFLTENIKYPIMAREANIQGTVFLSFIVSKTGEISDIAVLRGIGGGCDEEAVRVVGLMPEWEPGKQRGIAVNVRFTLPVKFILY
jgi:protein TonB